MERNNVLIALKERVKEQQLLQSLPFPQVFLFITHLLGENPWRVLVPLSALLTILLHIFFGKVYDETILWLFSYL